MKNADRFLFHRALPRQQRIDVILWVYIHVSLWNNYCNICEFITEVSDDLSATKGWDKRLISAITLN